MKPKRRTWWIWVVAAVVVLVVLAGAAWLLIASSPASNPVASPTVGATSTPTVSATPRPTVTPTPTFAPTPTATVTPPPDPEPTPTKPPAPALAQVSPFIVAADWDGETGTLSVSANVPQIVESDGTCTITASLGAVSVSDSFAATPSADSTDCGTHALSSDDFSTGDWTVVVSYSSSTSAGSATNQNPVSIP